MSTQSSSRQPTHRLYVIKGDDQNARWTEIGAAWANRDGQGFSLSFDAIPLEAVMDLGGGLIHPATDEHLPQAVSV